MKNNRIFRYMIIAVILPLCIFLFTDMSHASQPFELHLLDVGQGQCVLIEADGCYMLIDGGGRNSSSFVVSYLKQQGIENIDFIALSHYDEDHMSGLVGALSVFPVTQLLLPSYAGEGELYQSFAAAVVSNGAAILHPQAGDEFLLGSAIVEVIGPARTDYGSDNDQSLALRITYEDVSCLVCGDAEEMSETDIVNSGRDISADIYVVNHHGSRTSTTDAFLDAVAPAYALISCGQNNAYGHPTVEVLQRIQERGIQMYRTDLQGTVVLYSDGSFVWSDQEACRDWTPGIMEGQTRTIPADNGTVQADERAAGEGQTSEEITYVCNTNTMKFHYPSCNSVNQMNESNRMNTNLGREELIAQGYAPCGNCHP